MPPVGSPCWEEGEFRIQHEATHYNSTVNKTLIYAWLKLKTQNVKVYFKWPIRDHHDVHRVLCENELTPLF